MTNETNDPRRELLARVEREHEASVGTMPQYMADALEQRTSNRRTTPMTIRDSYVEASSVRAPYSNDRLTGGFRHAGEFFALVRHAATAEASKAARAAERLRNAALTTYGNENVGTDGGYAVPPEFRDEILRKVTAEDSLLSRTEQFMTNGHSVSFPKDETAPWSSAGVQAFWDGEAAVLTQRKPVLESTTVRLHKITCLVPMTDELIEDGPALASYLPTKAGEVIDAKVTDAIINGTGVGQPLGILNSPCLVTQAAEPSQIAGTIHGLNVIKMWARMPARWRSTAVWLAHPDVEPELLKAGLQVGPAAAGTATGGSLLYVPNGISGEPTDFLLGRPLVFAQSAKAPGTAGDLVFASLSNYWTFQRAPGLKSEASIHLWFDQGVTAFRFTLRIGGQPAYSAPIVDRNGSTTRGPFVALAAR